MTLNPRKDYKWCTKRINCNIFHCWLSRSHQYVNLGYLWTHRAHPILHEYNGSWPSSLWPTGLEIIQLNNWCFGQLHTVPNCFIVLATWLRDASADWASNHASYIVNGNRSLTAEWIQNRKMNTLYTYMFCFHLYDPMVCEYFTE